MGQKKLMAVVSRLPKVVKWFAWIEKKTKGETHCLMRQSTLVNNQRQHKSAALILHLVEKYNVEGLRIGNGTGQEVETEKIYQFYRFT